MKKRIKRADLMKYVNERFEEEYRSPETCPHDRPCPCNVKAEPRPVLITARDGHLTIVAV